MHFAFFLYSWQAYSGCEIDIAEWWLWNFGSSNGSQYSLSSGVHMTNAYPETFTYQDPQYNQDTFNFYVTPAQTQRGIWVEIAQEWTVNSASMYYNGKKIYTANYNWLNYDGTRAAPATIIFDNSVADAISGQGGVCPDNQLPAVMQIDHVRVYGRPNTVTGIPSGLQEAWFARLQDIYVDTPTSQALPNLTNWYGWYANNALTNVQSGFPASLNIKAVTGASAGTGGVVRLAVASTTGYTTGDTVYVAKMGTYSGTWSGTYEANGTWTCTVGAGYIELQGSVFAHAYTSGGYIQSVTNGGIMNVSGNAGTDAMDAPGNLGFFYPLVESNKGTSFSAIFVCTITASPVSTYGGFGLSSYGNGAFSFTWNNPADFRSIIWSNGSAFTGSGSVPIFLIGGGGYAAIKIEVSNLATNTVSVYYSDPTIVDTWHLVAAVGLGSYDGSHPLSLGIGGGATQFLKQAMMIDNRGKTNGVMTSADNSAALSMIQSNQLPTII
jgi:hypothetical protein